MEQNREVRVVFVGAFWCPSCPVSKNLAASSCERLGVPLEVLDMDKDDVPYKVTGLPAIFIETGEETISVPKVQMLSGMLEELGLAH